MLGIILGYQIGSNIIKRVYLFNILFLSNLKLILFIQLK